MRDAVRKPWKTAVPVVVAVGSAWGEHSHNGYIGQVLDNNSHITKQYYLILAILPTNINTTVQHIRPASFHIPAILLRTRLPIQFSLLVGSKDSFARCPFENEIVDAAEELIPSWFMIEDCVVYAIQHQEF